MIRSIKVDVNAAYPNMPLSPFHVFHGSAAAITILNVPRRIVALSVKVKNASGEDDVFDAQRSGSAWGTIIPGDFLKQSGTSTRGVKIEGADEAGNIYTLGAADLVVLLDNGSVTPVQPIPEGAVKHADFEDLTEDTVTVAELLRRLKGPIVACLVLASSLASAAIQTAPLKNIPGGCPVVTNADFSAEFAASTNYTVAAVSAATNGIRSVDGAARPLPKYLHIYNADDSSPDAAEEYYRSRGNGKANGGCASVRDGNTYSRNFDYPFDDRAEFVVRMSAGTQLPTANYQLPTRRYASVGVAQVGTNLTEAMVTSGKPEWSTRYKWLPGATVDGINENGVVCNINVVDGDPQTSGWRNMCDIHPLGAVRWALDNGETAEDTATNLAARITFPEGWTQNFHWMIADATSTYIVENGAAHEVTGRAVMTNFRLYPRDTTGAGQERYELLSDGANITNAWFTRCYSSATNPKWVSEFGGDTNALDAAIALWASKPREAHRGETFPTNYQLPTTNYSWWQTIHTSVYDITNRVLRVAVQEQDDWYTFAVPSAGGGVKPEAVREIVQPMIAGATNELRRVDDLNIYKRNHTEWTWRFDNGKDYDFDVQWFDTYPEDWEDPEPYPDPGWWCSGGWMGWAHPSYLGPAFKDRNAVYLRWEDFMVYDEEEEDVIVVPVTMTRSAIGGFSPTGDHLAKESSISNKADRSELSSKIGTSGTSTLADNFKLRGPLYGEEEDIIFFDGEAWNAWLRVDYAGEAGWTDFASSASFAETAVFAESAEGAGYADNAGDADTALHDADGHIISETYARKDEISADNPAFSNAVLAVGLNIDTNSVAVLNEIAATFGGFPIEGTATTVGGLLAALAAAVAWLKKNKADKTDLQYDTYIVPTTGADAYKLHARATNLLVFNSSSASYTFDLSANRPPDVQGKMTDFFLEVNTDAPVTVSTNAADTAKIRGDSPSVSAAGNYWITVSTKADGNIYIRNIKMEAPQS